MRHRFATLAAIYPAGLVALSVLHLLAPRRKGLRAMSQLFAPHLFLAAVPLARLAAVEPSRALRLALAGAAIVGVARFGPRPRWRLGAPAIATPPGGVRLDVLTWNVLADHRSPRDVVDGLLAAGAPPFVAIQELTSAVAAAIDDHPVLGARYPHRLLDPRDHDVLGMGLYSSLPLLEAGQAQRPPRQWATLELEGGTQLTVVNSHPVPPKIERRRLAGIPIPVGYDPVARDHGIRRLRELIDGSLERGDRLLVVGDFNLSDREPAYRELSAGLVDAQRAVGRWPGSTWQPAVLHRLPSGLLRIDHLFAGPGVRPVSVRVGRRSRGSDHHPIRATFDVQQAGPAGPGAAPLSPMPVQE